MKRDLIPTDLYPLDKVSTHHRSVTATREQWEAAVLAVYPETKFGCSKAWSKAWSYCDMEGRYVDAVCNRRYIGRYDRYTNESSIWTDENGEN